MVGSKSGHRDGAIPARTRSGRKKCKATGTGSPSEPEQASISASARAGRSAGVTALTWKRAFVSLEVAKDIMMMMRRREAERNWDQERRAARATQSLNHLRLKLNQTLGGDSIAAMG